MLKQGRYDFRVSGLGITREWTMTREAPAMSFGTCATVA
jgi:hypothetical protein